MKIQYPLSKINCTCKRESHLESVFITYLDLEIIRQSRHYNRYLKYI